MTHRFTRPFLSLLAALAALTIGLALAQDGASTTITTADHPEYGTHLTDAEGQSLYLFVDENAEATDPDRMTEGVRSNAAPCEGGCLENWPAVPGDAVEAGEGVDSELLYSADVAGTNQAVYNGWPLYYFASDMAPGDVMGQGLGGNGNMWYLLDDQGVAITGPAGDGAMDGDAADDDAANDDSADDATGDDGAMDGDDATQDEDADTN